MFSQTDRMNESRVPLNTIDLTQSFEEWCQFTKMQAGSACGGLLGDLSLSLRYIPIVGKLTVIIKEAKNLKKVEGDSVKNPYIRITLLMNGKRLMKKKTSIKKSGANPYYNESFSFDVPFEQVQKVSLIVTVVDFDRRGGSDSTGELTLGCSSSDNSELTHWLDMLANQRAPISMWHALKYPAYIPR